MNPDLSGYNLTSVGDPDPDPHVSGLPDPDPEVLYGSGSGCFPFLLTVLRGLKKCLQNKILTQNFRKIEF